MFHSLFQTFKQHGTRILINYMSEKRLLQFGQRQEQQQNKNTTLCSTYILFNIRLAQKSYAGKCFDICKQIFRLKYPSIGVMGRIDGNMKNVANITERLGDTHYQNFTEKNDLKVLNHKIHRICYYTRLWSTCFDNRLRHLINCSRKLLLILSFVLSNSIRIFFFKF